MDVPNIDTTLIAATENLSVADMTITENRSPVGSKKKWDIQPSGISKKRVLFIPASIRSHIIPTLFIADLLADTHTIYYAVTDQVLANIVTKNGYTPVMTDTFKVAYGMEQSFLKSKKKKAGFWQVLRSVYTNELFVYRKQMLDELMIQLQPDVVIIDIFSSTDFLVLYSYQSRVKILFYNPMMSTYRVSDFPIVSEGTWRKTTPPTDKPTLLILQQLVRNPRAELYQAALRYQWRKLQRLVGLSTKHEVIQTPFTWLFKNVPELVLAPLTFELSPDIRQPNQHYLGLCIRNQRADTELDPNFALQWPHLVNNKQMGKRLIYGSFGTFYTGSDRALLEFVTDLIQAIADIPNVQLICSVNGLVVETLKARYVSVPNVYFFKRVPQLDVLATTDVHITHGGLGSIKESILYSVPMLVYPLDLNYDQNGNGLKVEQHGLGLRGVFGRERTTNMKEKITRLLNDDSFRTNIDQFNATCAVTYAEDTIKKNLTHLLTTP